MAVWEAPLAFPPEASTSLSTTTQQRISAKHRGMLRDPHIEASKVGEMWTNWGGELRQPQMQFREGRKPAVAGASFCWEEQRASVSTPLGVRDANCTQPSHLGKDTVQGFCCGCLLLGGRCSKQRNVATEPYCTLDPQKLPSIVLGVKLRSTLSVNWNLSEQNCYFPPWLMAD